MTRLTKMEIVRTVLGLAILSLMVYSLISNYQTTKCQARFNQAFGAVTLIRSDATDRWRDDQIAYLDVVANPHASAAQRIASLNVYRESLRVAKAQRLATPLPKDPGCSE